MSPNRNILFRYIFREITGPFFVSLFVFTGILFLTRVLKLMELVVNRTATLPDILLFFSYIIPRFLELTIPMSLLLAIIIAFSRLSSDSELIAIRASGQSLQFLFRPVITFCTLIGLFTLLLTLWVRPWANYQLGKGLFEVAKKQASAGLIAGVFNDLGLLTVYATSIEEQGTKLTDVIIADQRNSEKPSIFIARNGLLISDDSARTLSFQLWDGSIHEGSGSSYSVTYFDINNINLNQQELLQNEAAEKGKKSDEMFVGELKKALWKLDQKPSPLSSADLKQRSRYQVEHQKRFVFPFSCVAIAMIAMALGIQPHRRSYSSSASYALGIFLILVYYVLVAFATALGEQALISPYIIMWLPNIIFIGVGYYFFQHIESEQWLALGGLYHHLLSKASQAMNLSLSSNTPSNRGK